MKGITATLLTVVETLYFTLASSALPVTNIYQLPSNSGSGKSLVRIAQQEVSPLQQLGQYSENYWDVIKIEEYEQELNKLETIVKRIEVCVYAPQFCTRGEDVTKDDVVKGLHLLALGHYIYSEHLEGEGKYYHRRKAQHYALGIYTNFGPEYVKSDEILTTLLDEAEAEQKILDDSPKELIDKKAPQIYGQSCIQYDPLEQKVLECEVPNLEDFRGKVVLLEFMLEGCDPCSRKIAKIKDILKSRENDLVIIGILVRGDINYAAQHEITFPVVIDGFYKTTRAYKVNAFPFSFIIDREGTIRAYGAISSDLLGKLLKDQVENN